MKISINLKYYNKINKKIVLKLVISKYNDSNKILKKTEKKFIM